MKEAAERMGALPNAADKFAMIAILDAKAYTSMDDLDAVLVEDGLAESVEEAKKLDLPFAVLREKDNGAITTLGIETRPEAMLIDPTGRIVARREMVMVAFHRALVPLAPLAERAVDLEETADVDLQEFADEKAFRVTGEGSITITAKMWDDDYADSVLVVVDADGNEITRNDDYSDEHYFSRVTFTAEAGKTYYVRALGFEGEPARYRITIKK